MTGHFRVSVPTTWPTPQLTAPRQAGFVTASRGTCSRVSFASRTRQPSRWTLTYNVRCDAGDTFAVRYTAPAPTRAGIYAFSTTARLNPWTTFQPFRTATRVQTTPAGPAKVKFASTLPARVAAGADLPGTPRVVVSDKYGNRTGARVKLAVAAPPVGAGDTTPVLRGKTTADSTSSTPASFNPVWVNEAGSSYRLRATTTTRSGQTISVLSGYLTVDPILSGGPIIPVATTYTNSTPGMAMLHDGRVLLTIVAWDYAVPNPPKAVIQAAVFDPVTDTWTPTGAPNQMIAYADLFTLSDGRVVAIGGQSSAPDIYDPETGAWTTGASNLVERSGGNADAVPLPDDKILVVANEEGHQTSVYDARADEWTPAGVLNPGGSYYGPALTALDDGRVMAGSRNADQWTPYGALDKTVMIFDPASGEWAPGAPFLSARRNVTLTTLDDGRVVATGGEPETGQSEIWDPTTGQWTHSAGSTTGRMYHTATLLQDGRIVYGGGGINYYAAYDAVVFDPATGTFSPRITGADVPQESAAIALPDGRVMFAAGRSSNATTFLGDADRTS